MNSKELLHLLASYAAQLRGDEVAEIDFVKLQSDLEAAIAAIERLEQRASTGQKLLDVFREDLLKRARAVARLTGRSAALTEKLIAADSASLDELLALKRDLDNEFETTFARTLSGSRNSGASDGVALNQFKVG